MFEHAFRQSCVTFATLSSTFRKVDGLWCHVTSWTCHNISVRPHIEMWGEAERKASRKKASSKLPMRKKFKITSHHFIINGGWFRPRIRSESPTEIMINYIQIHFRIRFFRSMSTSTATKTNLPKIKMELFPHIPWHTHTHTYIDTVRGMRSESWSHLSCI